MSRQTCIRKWPLTARYVGSRKARRQQAETQHTSMGSIHIPNMTQLKTATPQCLGLHVSTQYTYGKLKLQSVGNWGYETRSSPSFSWSIRGQAYNKARVWAKKTSPPDILQSFFTLFLLHTWQTKRKKLWIAHSLYIWWWLPNFVCIVNKFVMLSNSCTVRPMPA